jgi:hypothetical protein
VGGGEAGGSGGAVLRSSSRLCRLGQSELLMACIFFLRCAVWRCGHLAEMVSCLVTTAPRETESLHFPAVPTKTSAQFMFSGAHLSMRRIIIPQTYP